jgi:hypothetical protein
MHVARVACVASYGTERALELAHAVVEPRLRGTPFAHQVFDEAHFAARAVLAVATVASMSVAALAESVVEESDRRSRWPSQ